ncbi:MAG: 3-hydroxyacyl-CoA dehydrogenase NAD-binding domain-containing protein, partial [Actinomycetota bacterium]|nr:3-hydroxyacyl-CoA dehydrogenase NAD-binding domain-containing protein [Actinomycetota bacterium]
MGAGIVEVFARAGLAVVGHEPEEAALGRGRAHLDRSFDRAVRRGRLDADARREVDARISLTTSVADLAPCDLVVEAVPERLDIKHSVFTALDEVCRPDAVLATNTSSLSVTRIAAATSRPGRVVGMHFFNPAPVQRLVEVVHTVLTVAEVVDTARALAVRLRKTPVVVGDRAGFVANALLFGYLNQAAGLVSRREAALDDIDAAMRLGAGLPMGPFALLDLIGLDTTVEILETMFAQSRDARHVPDPLLRELVAAGRLGRKPGRGFLDHGDGGSAGAAPAAADAAVGMATA